MRPVSWACRRPSHWEDEDLTGSQHVLPPAPVCVLIPLLTRTHLTGSGPALMIPLKLIFLLGNPVSSHSAVLGVRTSTYEFEGNTVQPTTPGN